MMMMMITMMMLMPICTLLNISNLYADDDARSMTPSRNTRSYTLRSVPSSPGRSFLSKTFFRCNCKNFAPNTQGIVHISSKLEKNLSKYSIDVLFGHASDESILGDSIMGSTWNGGNIDYSQPPHRPLRQDTISPQFQEHTHTISSYIESQYS